MPKSPDDRAQSVEHRTATRLLRKESVSIQVLRPNAEDDASAEVVASETIDISANGLRLLLPEPLEADRIFDICIKLKDDPKRFLLTGETRWCRYSGERQGHEVGIEILDGEETDFAAWSESIGEGSEKPIPTPLSNNPHWGEASMDHDQAQLALHRGELTEATITPAQDANGWIVLLTHKNGEQSLYAGHSGSEKVYHSLDRATEVARELGFETIRVEEEF